VADHCAISGPALGQAAKLAHTPINEALTPAYNKGVLARRNALNKFIRRIQNLMGQMTIAVVDYDGETSTANFPAPDMTAANSDAIYADGLTLQNALDGIVRGLLVKKTHTAKVSTLAVGKATSEEAAREEKALVRYYDDTTFARATMEIPAIDMTLQHPTIPGVFYRAGVSGHEAAIGTFVTAFQAFVPGPGGNTAVVQEIIHVGRNL
jgi:hypothetical protein